MEADHVLMILGIKGSEDKRNKVKIGHWDEKGRGIFKRRWEGAGKVAVHVAECFAACRELEKQKRKIRRGGEREKRNR